MNLTDLQRTILVQLLRSDGAMSTAEVAETTGRPRSTVGGNLNRLCRAGLAETLGSTYSNAVCYGLTAEGRAAMGAPKPAKPTEEQQ